MNYNYVTNPNLKRNLTIRYLVALLLIAGVILASYFVMHRQIISNETDAYVINISGMQRMLSQRIALFSREIYDAKDANEAQLLLNKMEKSVEKMKSNHRQLTSGDLGEQGRYQLSPTLINMYFKNRGINDRITEYLNYADDFIILYKTEGWESVQASPLTDNITKIARNGLLKLLNTAVFQYEAEAQAKIQQSKKIEQFILIFGLLVLLAEIIFIFHPMITVIYRNINSLETSNHELTEFSYRISHDLRAPVVSSMGLAQLTKSSIETNNSGIALQSIEHIQNSLTKLEALIEDIINMTRMKMTDIPLESVHLEDLIDESVEKFKNLPNYDAIEIRKSINIQRPIQIKRLYLQQILENLISNAIKYYAPEKTAPYIEISATNTNGMTEIIVKDNGMGIPENQRMNIFGMFQRFHPKQSFGSGLGLYLVKQNAYALGGDIVYKNLSDGTQFKVYFPST